MSSLQRKASTPEVSFAPQAAPSTDTAATGNSMSEGRLGSGRSPARQGTHGNAEVQRSLLDSSGESDGAAKTTSGGAKEVTVISKNLAADKVTLIVSAGSAHGVEEGDKAVMNLSHRTSYVSTVVSLYATRCKIIFWRHQLPSNYDPAILEIEDVFVGEGPNKYPTENERDKKSDDDRAEENAEGFRPGSKV
jgi:hypothetical protein